MPSSRVSSNTKNSLSQLVPSEQKNDTNSIRSDRVSKQAVPVNQESQKEKKVVQQNQEMNNQNEEEGIEEEEDLDKQKWSEKEDNLLLCLHNKLGNKWTDISNQFENRDHNNVKNHFYAQIRKSVRRINLHIKKYMSHLFKPINMSHISKMVTMISQKTTPSPTLIPLINTKNEEFQDIKKRVFQFSKLDEGRQVNQYYLNELVVLIQDISFFMNEIKKDNLINKKKKNKAKIAKSLSEYHLSIKAPIVKAEDDIFKIEKQNYTVKQEFKEVKIQEVNERNENGSQFSWTQFQPAIFSINSFPFIPSNFMVFPPNYDTYYFSAAHPQGP